MRCTMCGQSLDDEASCCPNPSSRYSLNLCEDCRAEYRAFLDVSQGRKASTVFWHNKEWVAMWRSWLEFQRSMREFLWEHSRIPAEQLRQAGCPAWIEIDPSKVARDSLALDPWPITASPGNFVIVVAGGGHPTNSYWLQGYSPGVVGRAIELPASFAGLLADAEGDLGPR